MAQGQVTGKNPLISTVQISQTTSLYKNHIRKLNDVFEDNLKLPITISQTRNNLDNVDIYIYFHDQDKFKFLDIVLGLVSQKFGMIKENLIEKYGDSLLKLSEVGMANCSVFYFNSGIVNGQFYGETQFPIVLMNKRYISQNPSKLLPDCMTEELGHALTFWNDSDPTLLKNSMFTSSPDVNSNTLIDFSKDELFLMSVLSDKRIKNGMNRTSANKIMWKIIAEKLPYISVNPFEYLHLAITGKLNDYKSKNPKLNSILNKIDTSKI